MVWVKENWFPQRKQLIWCLIAVGLFLSFFAAVSLAQSFDEIQDEGFDIGAEGIGSGLETSVTTTTSTPEKSAPKGEDTGGAKSAATISADEKSGSFSYAVPVPLPPGVNGLTPSLSISYNSSGSTRGMLGAGFSLSGTSDCITRRGAAKTVSNLGSVFPRGMPSFDQGDVFYRNGERLIACDSLGADRPNSCPVGTYRALHNDFAKVEFDRTNLKIVVSEPNGIVKEYAQAQRAGGGINPLNFPNDFDHQVSFCISAVNHNGNLINYIYENGTPAYLSRIEYGGAQGASPIWRVSLNYITKPEAFRQSSYSSGAYEAETQTLDSILITKINDGTRLNKVFLTYHANSDLEQLQQVRVCGVDDQSCELPYHFSYVEGDFLQFGRTSQSGWVGTDGWQNSAGLGLSTQNALVKTANYPVFGQSQPAPQQIPLGTELVDINSDGYPDLVRHDDLLRGKVWLNRSGFFVENPDWEQKISSLPLMYTGMPPQTREPGPRFMDMNGDGYQDYGPYLWNQATQGFEFNSTYAGTDYKLDTFQDLNADGLPERVGPRLEVELNTGSGFVAAPPGLFPPPTDSRSYTEECRFLGGILRDTLQSSGGREIKIDTGVRFVDLNSDGLPDLLQLLKDNARGNGATPQFCINAWINTGSGWSEDVGLREKIRSQINPNLYFASLEVEGWGVGESCSPDPFGDDCGGLGCCSTTSYPYITSNAAGTLGQDLDHDGLAEMFRSSCRETSQNVFGCTTVSRTLNPLAANVFSSADVPWSASTEGYYAIKRLKERTTNLNGSEIVQVPSQDLDGAVRLVDLNKDGLLDIFANRDDLTGQKSLIQYNIGTIGSNLLSSVVTPLGERVSVEYMAVDGYLSGPFASHSGTSPKLTQPVTVVRNITRTSRSDRALQTPFSALSQSFVYRGGVFDAVERSFIGFERATVFENADTEHQSIRSAGFSTDLTKRCILGAPIYSSLSGSKCQLNEPRPEECSELLVTETHYAECGADNLGPIFSPPTEQITRLKNVQGFGGLAEITSKKTFEYDSFGNQAGVYDYLSETSATPYRLHYSVFAAPSHNGAWITGLPCQSGLVGFENGRSVPITGSYLYYDKKDLCASPTNGLLSRTESRDWLSTNYPDRAPSPDKVESYEYTDSGNVKEVRDSLGHITRTDWSSVFPEILPNSKSNAKGHRTFFSYDRYGRLSSTRNPNSTITQVLYDSRHRPTGGWTRSLLGGMVGRSSVSYVEPTQAGEWQQESGRYEIINESELDEGRFVRTSQFIDGFGRSYLESTHSGSSCISVARLHDGAGKVLKQTVPFSGCAYPGDDTGIDSSIAVTESEYDALGRTISVRAPGNILSETSYFISGSGDAARLIQENWFDQGALILPSQASFSYTDSLGRVTKVAQCKGGDCWATRFGYLGDDPVQDLSQNSFNEVSVSDYSHDYSDSITKITLPHLLSAEAPGTIYNFYDGFGQLIAQKDPNLSNCEDRNPESLNSGCAVRTYFNSLGKVIRTTDAKFALDFTSGTDTRTEYDELGRPTSVTAMQGASNRTYGYSYDSDGCGSLGAIGALTRASVTEWNGNMMNATEALPTKKSAKEVLATSSIRAATSFSSSEESCFDRFGRKQSRNVTVTLPGDQAAQSFHFDYRYLSGGARSAVVLPNGETVSTDYDDLGRQVSLQSSTAGALVTGALYQPTGELKDINLGNGITLRRVYRDGQFGDQRLQSLQALRGSTSLLGISFDYDLKGNILSLTQSNPSRTFAHGFYYDELDRLTDWLLYADGGWRAIDSYGYNPLGNRTSHLRFADPTSALLSARGVAKVDLESLLAAKVESKAESKYSSSTALVTEFTNFGVSQIGEAGPHAAICSTSTPNGACNSGAVTYRYDPNGNLTYFSDPTRSKTLSFFYDAENHQIGSSDSSGHTVTSFYGAGGSRIAELDGATTLYLGDGVEVVNGAYRVQYSFSGERIASREQSGQTKYFFNDHLGSVVGEFNAGGDLVHELVYSPFGERIDSTARQADKHQFNGNTIDGTGNYYYGARWYRPELGRFNQADTVIPDLYNPQALNRYAYTFNNPLRYTDPSGHTPEEEANAARQRLLEQAVAVTQFAQNLGYELFVQPMSDLASRIAKATTIPHAEEVRDAAAASQTAINGPAAGALAAALIPTNAVELAITVADVADGPAPELTGARIASRFGNARTQALAEGTLKQGSLKSLGLLGEFVPRGTAQEARSRLQAIADILTPEDINALRDKMKSQGVDFHILSRTNKAGKQGEFSVDLVDRANPYRIVFDFSPSTGAHNVRITDTHIDRGGP